MTSNHIFFRWKRVFGMTVLGALMSGCSSLPMDDAGMAHPVLPTPLVIPMKPPVPPAFVPIPGTPFRLDVHEAVALALKQGPSVMGGTLDRESQRILNEAAARMFEPRVSLISSYERNVAVSTTDRTVDKRPFHGARTSIKAITGGELKAEVSRAGASSASGTSGAGRASLELTQPLLRGGGIRIGTLELRALRLAERGSVLGLEAVKRAAVADAFGAYYALYEAGQSRAIADRALLRARESEKVNQLMVEAGRLARVDLLQTRADVARAELQLEQAENIEKDAQRRLAMVLGLPVQTQFELPPLAEDVVVQVMPEDEALKLAWDRRIEVRLADDAVSTQRLNLERAHDDLLPRLDLSLRSEQAIGRVASDGLLMNPQRPRSNTVALSLEVPLTRSDVLAARSSAEIGLQRAQTARDDLRVGIETEVRNAMAGIASAKRALVLAQTTLELQRGRLEAEGEKLKVGRTSTSQVSDAQDGVRNAEREELGARLELVRKSFELDQAVGRSVEVWSRVP